MLEIEVLCQNYGVQTLYALGGACEGEVADEEEIDFLIDFNGLSYNSAMIQRYKVAHLLEKVLQHKIEVKIKSEIQVLGNGATRRILLYKKMK